MRSTRIALTWTATVVAAVLAATTMAVPAEAASKREVSRSLLTADEALDITGLTGPLSLGSEGCRQNDERTACTREWQGDARTKVIPTAVHVSVYTSRRPARWAMQDVKNDAPPYVVRVGKRVLVAYYESTRYGTEAHGWRRVGPTVVRVSCTGPKSRRAEAVACVEDLLAAQVTQAPRS